MSLLFPKPQATKKRKAAKRKSKEEFWSHPNVEAARNSRCVCCPRQPPSDPHHLISRGAGGGNEKNNVMGFCREHHTEIHKLGIARMAEKYSKFDIILRTNGWVFCPAIKQWSRI